MSVFAVPHAKMVFDGKPLFTLLPRRERDNYKIRDLMRRLKSWLEEGNQIFVEFTQGARKGTVARLDLQAHECDTLYKEIRSGNGNEMEMTKNIWAFLFDDRKTTIKVEHHGWHQNWPAGAVIRFDQPETTWVYTTTAKAKQPQAQLYDHFGVLIEVGAMVLVPQGTKGNTRTRFAFVKSITAAGTIKVESIKTRKGHEKLESNVSPTIEPYDLVVLDGDTSIKDKVTMAKLANG